VPIPAVEEFNGAEEGDPQGEEEDPQEAEEIREGTQEDPEPQETPSQEDS